MGKVSLLRRALASVPNTASPVANYGARRRRPHDEMLPEHLFRLLQSPADFAAVQAGMVTTV
jgi:hypothetical protein